MKNSRTDKERLLGLMQMLFDSNLNNIKLLARELDKKEEYIVWLEKMLKKAFDEGYRTGKNADA